MTILTRCPSPRRQYYTSGLYNATQLLFEVQTPSSYISMASTVCPVGVYTTLYLVWIVPHSSKLHPYWLWLQVAWTKG